MTIKYFKEKISAIDTTRYYKESQRTETVYKHASFMRDYCVYLADILQTFQLVVIRMNVHSRFRTLTIDYVKGESRILIDGWNEAILLPEIEKIVAENRKQIVVNYITENLAA